MSELEHHVELAPLAAAEIERGVDGDVPALADRQHVAPGERLAVHLLQIGVQVRAHLVAPGVHVLADQVDHVHAEAGDAAVEPPVHHRVDLGPERRVRPVEVGLRGAEEVQVVLADLGHPGPGRAAEDRLPVVGRAAVRPGVAPDVVAVLGPCCVAPGGQEPRVLVRAVIDHEVHHDADAARPRLRDQPVEIGECSEFRRDVAVIRDVVAVVGHRRAVDRRQPDEADAQIGEMIELRDDAGNVAHPVAVRVAEAARIDLVAGGAVPPFLRRCRHGGP